ncbi:hypothetical protein [Bradyrhizobium sp. ORS 86]|uniref:hypothetical protein n=1 Tax=Bradyrhizobium sp. ORS 86 TaxID=1685970 RepID=UPI00388D27BF
MDTAQLRNDRRRYLRLREEAAQIAAAYPETDLGRDMAEQCRIVDGAIADVDAALRIRQCA